MIADDLRAIAGAAHVFEGPDIEPRYLTDEMGGPIVVPCLLVRPADTQQLSAILRLCSKMGQPVVMQGGRTGLTRAALPLPGELIISLERFRMIGAIDEIAGTMVLEAGVPLAVAQDAAVEAGWQLAVDIGARGSCTIGGMIATNAGGTQVLRYGMMREQVLGLEAVLADGTIISSMSPMLKDNCGYDLKQLFIGSEGTLGVVTRALLRLRPLPVGRQTLLFALNDYPSAISLLNLLQRHTASGLTAFELMWDDYVRSAEALLGASPFDMLYPLYALVQVEAPDAMGVDEALNEAAEQGLVADAIVAQSHRDEMRLWRWREAIAELMPAMAPAEPFDVSVPITRIGALVDNIRAQLAQQLPEAKAIFFGHAADGNLHIAIGCPDEHGHVIGERIVYDAVRDEKGSVSAEHGIGLLKKRWLAHTRSASEIGLMRQLKRSLDPAAILNRGRIF